MIVLVFDQDAELKEMGKTGAAPELTTAPETALKLFAQGLHRPAANWASSLLHSAVVEVVLMIFEVADFAGDGCLISGGPRSGWGWVQQFLQFLDHA
ncbi:MAG: hypothetical protein EXS25_12025, partial [Pedosphaera sp.]|nr:hypothetical protein [Pedosphaera sp.]